MKISNVNNERDPDNVEINASLTPAEFEQLAGELENLGVFAVKRLEEPASIIRTGAKHTYAKYVLFPSRLRKNYKTAQYDFDQVRCGTLEDEERLHIVYSVPRKGVTAKKKEEPRNGFRRY